MKNVVARTPGFGVRGSSLGKASDLKDEGRRYARSRGRSHYFWISRISTGYFAGKGTSMPRRNCSPVKSPSA